MEPSAIVDRQIKIVTVFWRKVEPDRRGTPLA
jgi:hypothetical protein